MQTKIDKFVKSTGFLIFIFAYIMIDQNIQSDFSNIEKQPLLWSIKFLSLPILLFGCVLYVFFLKETRLRNGDLKVFIISVLISAVFVIFSSGYILLVNKSLGNPSNIVLRGVVVSKKTDCRSFGKGCKLVEHYLTIFDETSKSITRLNVPKNEFSKYQVESLYYETWNKGYLGIVYK